MRDRSDRVYVTDFKRDLAAAVIAKIGPKRAEDGSGYGLISMRPFQILLSANSGRHSEVKKIAVEGGQIAAIVFSTEHGITDQLTRAGQFFPPTFPALVRNRLDK